MGSILIAQLQQNSPIAFDHFDLLKVIGKGSFGKVCVISQPWYFYPSQT